MISILKYLGRYLLSFIILTNIILFGLNFHNVINVDSTIYILSSILSFIIAFNKIKDCLKVMLFNSILILSPYIILNIINLGILSTKLFDNNINYLQFNNISYLNNHEMLHPIFLCLFIFLLFLNIGYLTLDRGDGDYDDYY